MQPDREDGARITDLKGLFFLLPENVAASQSRSRHMKVSEFKTEGVQCCLYERVRCMTAIKVDKIIITVTCRFSKNSTVDER